MAETEFARESPLTIRPFDGSLADAEGLLAVEKATFDESPYSAAEVQAMLSEGWQRAWLASDGEQIAGFVIGFPVHGLHRAWWEVDLLAVHPEWRGRRLGHRLIAETMAFGAGTCQRGRALVADDNNASQQAFLRAGFRVMPGGRELLILRPGEGGRRQRARWGGSVREASGPGEIAGYLAGRPVQEILALPGGAVDWSTPACGGQPGGRGPTLLVAEKETGEGEILISGYAELVEVETLLYRGIWIESLQATSAGARGALVDRAVDLALVAGLDEISAVVYERDAAMQAALRGAGFRSLGGFRWLAAEMPESRACR
ncbi:MAG TPA: GNAT family N-acetyltransferase [Anaerolineae bacterium]|nr:GNAT family N-acetyltransferase [Anaerolineae bacterium]